MVRILGQVIAETSEPWTDDELAEFAGRLANAEVAVSADRRIIATRFDFNPEGVGSLSVSTREMVSAALIGIKDEAKVEYHDSRWLRPG